MSIGYLLCHRAWLGFHIVSSLTARLLYAQHASGFLSVVMLSITPYEADEITVLSTRHNSKTHYTSK